MRIFTEKSNVDDEEISSKFILVQFKVFDKSSFPIKFYLSVDPNQHILGSNVMQEMDHMGFSCKILANNNALFAIKNSTHIFPKFFPFIGATTDSSVESPSNSLVNEMREELPEVSLSINFVGVDEIGVEDDEEQPAEIAEIIENQPVELAEIVQEDQPIMLQPEPLEGNSMGNSQPKVRYNFFDEESGRNGFFKDDSEAVFAIILRIKRKLIYHGMAK